MLDEEEEVAAVRAALRKPNKVAGFNGVKAQVKLVMRKGYSVAQLLNQVRRGTSLLYHRSNLLYSDPQLHDVIVMHPGMTARQQAASGLVLGEADKALIDGGDEELQLLEVALKIHQIMKKD